MNIKYRMTASIACLVLATLNATPAPAWHVSLADRQQLSQSVADFIHYRQSGEPNPFKTNGVEIGATAIDGEGPNWFAIADWQSVDSTTHGQVFFFNKCGWQVEDVVIGRTYSVSSLIALRVPANTAKELVMNLAQAEAKHVAYLKPAAWGHPC